MNKTQLKDAFERYADFACVHGNQMRACPDCLLKLEIELSTPNPKATEFVTLP